MRRFWVACALGFGLAGGVVAFGANEEPATTQGAVAATRAAGAATQGARGEAAWEDLVARLGDERFKVRQGAQEELERTGAGELGTLKRLAGEAQSAEVQAALSRRVQEISDGLAVDPPGISVNFDNATLGEVAQGLSAATGTALKSWPEDRFGNRNMRFTLKAKGEPFWDVFCKLSAQHGLRLQSQGSGLALMQEQPGWRRFVRLGGVALFPMSISRNSETNLQAPAGKQVSSPQMSLSYVVVADPRINVLRYGGVRFLRVVDDAGNVLHSEADGEPQFWRWGANACGWQEGTQLTIPAAPGKKVSSAKGVVYMEVGLAEVSTEVAEIEKKWKTPVKVAGHTIRFNSFQAKKDSVNFSLQVTHEGGRGFRPDDVPVKMALIDATGKPVWDSSIQGGLGAGLGGQYTLPLKVKFSVATRTKQLKLPFELKDLPLPRQ